MAKSPAHRFGQIIGDLIEEIMTPQLQAFCSDHKTIQQIAALECEVSRHSRRNSNNVILL